MRLKLCEPLPAERHLANEAIDQMSFIFRRKRMDYHADDRNGSLNSGFEIIQKPLAKRYIKRLPSNVQERVFSLIKNLSGNPYPSGCKKKQGVDDLYGFSIGSYRLYYIVQAQTKVVLIVWAGHHQVDYRRPKFWAKFR